jgi:Tol biopolymer transport system component/DNA-binding winged helix-turn-helix (wHTH) protein
MVTQPQSPSRLAFGPFEVDPAADELLKGGTRIRLPGQPFQILLMLLAHPGEVVTREQLRDQIWNEGTFVDFEHGLNAAMNKLRRALGDSADNPRYIETVPGRGYRFIGTLEHRLRPPLAILTPPPQHPAATPAAKPRFFSPKFAWLLATMATAFGIWGLTTLLTTKRESGPRKVVQFDISQPPGSVYSPPIARQPFAISPDGARLAFTATGVGGTRIWTRDLAALDLRPVPGTEGTLSVFWSPDSKSIFFTVRRSLKQTNLDSGSTRTVANLNKHAIYGAWRSNHDLVLYMGQRTFYELTVDNGAVHELPPADMRWLQFLPGTDQYVSVVFDPALRRYRTTATDFVTRKSTPLMEADSRVEYAPPLRPGQPGYLLFIRGGSLLAQPFDAKRLLLIGEPSPIVQNVLFFRPTASASFSVSDNGVLVYQAGAPLSELRWYDRAGNVTGTAGGPVPFSGPLRLSPDGRNVVADVWSPDFGNRDIWLFSQDGKEKRRLTVPTAQHIRPIWSPDGKRVIFCSSQTGPCVLTSLETNEGSKEIQLKEAIHTKAPADLQIPTDWSRDGRFITYDTSIGEQEREVWLAAASDGKSAPLLHGEFAQWGAAFSPDTKRIAFISDESGRPEVYVQAFEPLPTPHTIGERRQVSRDGAWLVRWRPDGREIFYLGLDNWLHAVPVKAPLQFGQPGRLFQVPGTSQYDTSSDFQFDVTHDGQHFIMSTTGSMIPPNFTVIENWQDKFSR